MDTQQNPTPPKPFEWNQAKTEAAELLAVDELTKAEIAKKIGVNVWTLWTWRQHPDFAAKVASIVERMDELSERRAIGKRSRRLQWLDDQLKRLMTVIRERAADPDMSDVPGGKTGMIVRRHKGLGSGASFRIVEEFEVDTALTREIREHMKQAAQELGQWTERHEVEQSGSEVTEIVITTREEAQKILANLPQAGGLPGQ